MATEFHDCDLFFDFVFLAAKVVGDGQVRPRARDSLSLELVEPVGAGVVARHDFDSLREKERRGRTVPTFVGEVGMYVGRKWRGGEGSKRWG
jgi:hypothetical protein